MAGEPTFRDTHLQALCDIIGDTEEGLTGKEIGRCLASCNIEDLEPGATKRHRLFAALGAKQGADRCANGVLAFVKHVMDPVRYVGPREQFEHRRSALNAVLAFCSVVLGEDGELRRARAARTVSEAEAAAGMLRKALVERRGHVDVLKFCKAELVADNYFHAVFEATKSVAEKLREKSGMTSDGGKLVDEALGLGRLGVPRLAFNSLRTESEHSEHKGLMNLIKGVFGAFRNTTAHSPRIRWRMTKDDALDVLTTISLIHRRLDGAVITYTLGKG